jgi:hypothetical protein
MKVRLLGDAGYTCLRHVDTSVVLEAEPYITATGKCYGITINRRELFKAVPPGTDFPLSFERVPFLKGEYEIVEE